MNQLKSDAYERCQQGQKLLTESKRFRQRSQQLKSAAKIQCQEAKHLQNKSNNVLQKSQQLQSRHLKLINRLHGVPNNPETTQLSTNDLDRRFQRINELQSDVDQRLQAAKKLQFKVDRCFEKVSHLLKNPNLNSASELSQAPDLTDSKIVLKDIDYLIKKLEIGYWLD